MNWAIPLQKSDVNSQRRPRALLESRFCNSCTAAGRCVCADALPENPQFCLLEEAGELRLEVYKKIGLRQSQ
uniref:Uncharacterized protein n=1 Tax=Rubinisphaera brasiliensis (strain ATCC 49424 / DSM 5305 / JCM 21570 / IAM 15109 / NBRC 103401 / IFAM 1448) TaxID=756272 RepID=F0SH80_RUBBR|nr:hypothetical protein Plabr_3024 [Rubinisphaera brasiliensis DSM 5305]